MLPLIIILFVWNLGERMLSNNPLASTSGIQVPQTIVEKTELVEFDRDGIALHWLRSEELRTDGTSQTVYITAPVINVDPHLTTSWDAKSVEGIYSKDKDMLRLTGGVTLTKREKGTAPVILTTDQLEFFPEKNVAQSSTPVLIETKGHRVESIGISVDFNASIYVLNSKVKSTHEPF